MKSISISEYEAQATRYHEKVLNESSIFCVDCGSGRKFVVMEESQHKIMDDALKTVLVAADMDDETYKAVMRAAKHAGVTGSYGRDV